MSTCYLPKSITKDVLFKRAQARFQEWVKMYADPDTSAQWMYEDMSALCYCGDPKDDFPDDFKQIPVRISDNAFRYRGITFKITSDEDDDKELIWCSYFKETDEFIDWVWGTFFIGDKWQGNTEILDKFIDSHKEE